MLTYYIPFWAPKHGTGPGAGKYPVASVLKEKHSCQHRQKVKKAVASDASRSGTGRDCGTGQTDRQPASQPDRQILYRAKENKQIIG